MLLASKQSVDIHLVHFYIVGIISAVGDRFCRRAFKSASRDQGDGVAYQKNATSTDLWRAGIHNVPNFFFYTYYREEDIESRSVGDYMNAQKLFQIDDLDEEDFPLLKYEKENMK